MNLTKSQERAIKHRLDNLQLIACAGSGKTEVVARRVVHLLTPGHKDSLESAASARATIGNAAKRTCRHVTGIS